MRAAFVIVAMFSTFLFSRASGAAADGGPAPTTRSAEEVVDRSANVSSFGWSALPSIPDARGVAAPYAGASNGTLIVAGGANFPEAPPWSGGIKVWHDAVYVLPKGAAAWQVDALKLTDGPRGYGVSVTTADGVICVGGSDASRHYADAFRLRFVDGCVTRDALPALPVALANLSGAVLGDTLYVAGGTESPTSTAASAKFFALDLKTIGTGWTELPSWPGPARMLAVAAAQDGAFYLVSGVSLSAGADGKPVREYLRDAYCYRPKSGWMKIADVPRPIVAAPSPAATVGSTHFLIFGGDDGANVGRTTDHPGFSDETLAYHTLTNSWVPMGRAAWAAVTTTVVPYDGGFVVPSGEVRPGVRSPAVAMVRPSHEKASFGWVNYLTLAIYLALMLGIGLWFTRGEKSSDEFFRGGQRIPWWAAGLSIYATMLSSISYMAIPAKAFMSDWTFVFNGVAILVVAPIVVYVYLPFYRQLDVTSAYEYLERRFNYATRAFASASFILLQVGRMAIVLYLPALALATVSSFDIYICIVLMGVLCILYTVFGGIEAVIWTDAIQAVVLAGGAVVALALIIARVDGGIMGAFAIARADAKLFENVSFRWDTAAATAAVVLVGSMFSSLSSYTASQDVVQRYVTTKDGRLAARSVWTNALISVPSTALFFLVGTGLYAFYKSHPERLDPSLPTDAIFPLFMVRELPAGIAGVVVAGIFAAAQSTLSSSLNSVATAYVTDFHGRLRPGMTDRGALRLAQLITVVLGVVAIVIACVMASRGVNSLWDVFLQLLGLTGGALAGLFALGIFTRRANGTGAIVGALVSAVVLYFVQRSPSVNFLLYSAVGTLTCVVAGYLVSLIVPTRTKSLDGLTIFTRRRETVTLEPAGDAAPLPA